MRKTAYNATNSLIVYFLTKTFGCFNNQDPYNPKTKIIFDGWISMNGMNKIWKCSAALLLFCCVISVSAETPQTTHNSSQVVTNNNTESTVQERLQEEKEANPYTIIYHRPTYVLPFYYTGSPYNSIYQGNTPANQSIQSTEIKYQFSFKVPVWRNILKSKNSLYLAYTQMSYWQAYNKSAFFRETNYEPEVFLSHNFEYHFPNSRWTFNFLNLGLVHQSNGLGGTLERSWNRAYLVGVASTENWAVGFSPWMVFHDGTYERQNPNLAYYLGYEEFTVAYKYKQQVFALESQNLFESGGKRAGTTLSWSFPLTKFIKGYVQVFTGYGQSLIEYNHRTNSAGVGIALSNWL